MGERIGNGTLDDIATQLAGDTRFHAYQIALQKVLGIHPGDKPIGSAQAFCGTGGMHADHALKKLWELIDAERKMKKNEEPEPQFVRRCYDKFVSTYNGSYASVPPSRFGQKLQMTLSPVAGKANVLFMLAGMGLDLRDKNDKRLDEVLAEVKDGEHNHARNYRGYNNANAFLLLAEKFGLRNATAAHITVTPSAKPHFPQVAVLDMNVKNGERMRSAELRHGPSTPGAGAALKHGPDHDPHVDGAESLQPVAQQMLAQAKQTLRLVDRRFDQMAVKDLRVLEGPVGGVEPEGGNVLRPKPERIRSAVKLILSMGGKEMFQANGAGITYEEAIGGALQAALNYKGFQIEQAQGKAAGPVRP